MTDSDEDEQRGGYERWLEGLAGERVKTLPIFVVWLLVITVAGGAAYWLGVPEEQGLTAVVAAVSVPYWLWAVPRHVSRRRERR